MLVVVAAVTLLASSSSSYSSSSSSRLFGKHDSAVFEREYEDCINVPTVVRD
jgi:hypothetical protein